MRNIIIIILILSFYGCSLPIYIPKESSGDRIIFVNEPRKNTYMENSININRLGREVGKLFYNGNSVNLTFLNGHKIELYKQHQYSGVYKITQSFDDKMIRVYYWRAVLKGEDRITELDLDKFTINTYRILDNSFNPSEIMSRAYSKVNLGDGVDKKEAAVLADNYFKAHISACGATSLNPIDKGNLWEIETKIGFAATPYDPIIIDKKTGKITCSRGPAVEPPK